MNNFNEFDEKENEPKKKRRFRLFDSQREGKGSSPFAFISHLSYHKAAKSARYATEFKNILQNARANRFEL